MYCCVVIDEIVYDVVGVIWMIDYIENDVLVNGVGSCYVVMWDCIDVWGVFGMCWDD